MPLAPGMLDVGPMSHAVAAAVSRLRPSLPGHAAQGSAGPLYLKPCISVLQRTLHAGRSQCKLGAAHDQRHWRLWKAQVPSFSLHVSRHYHPIAAAAGCDHGW